ncbi:unnamed protein product [Coffea canephora]|uniref:eRF1/Pelota-like N-terminal domain-containing protein n=1 Tax=Coffea canephora TaxID=49390 RepID=A0A068TX38_COFCA|nr:unnamed protein product [Coffea canephora]
MLKLVAIVASNRAVVVTLVSADCVAVLHRGGKWGGVDRELGSRRKTAQPPPPTAPQSSGSKDLFLQGLSGAVFAMADGAENDKNIEIWKVKKLIKALESARGNGTSMISLIIPPGDQISRVNKMLAEEYGTASNIKSRVNRQSVLAAITSAQQKLKLYNKVPPNGLVLYTGTVVTEDGKEKKVTFAFEPFKPINASLYLCDNKFHTEPLSELLESDEKFGFIVMDGNGTLFGTLSGNTREVLHKFTVDLPKKHGRGGQSALRFARLRMEKRHNYVRKTAELATQFFINPATSQPNVSGLILAGSADFKTELSQSDMFDPRLQAKILNVVDVSYGGENGFNQAIELSAEILANVKFIQEKRLIGKFFEEISQDTGKYVFGVDDTLKALEMGAVETLIVWENLDINRYTEKMPLLEWFANEYKKFGCVLEFVTNKSQEGSQFCRGFGGIGGILRYQLDMRSFDEPSDEGELYEDSD